MRDLQGRFIEATWTCATRQQKSDKQKGHRPDFRPHYAPSRYSKAYSYKSTANNERLAMPRCFLAPRAQLCIHALIAQGLPLYAICATARERIALDVDGTEVIFDPPQAGFPQQRDARRRMSTSKI
jgi:hypothetical protein